MKDKKENWLKVLLSYAEDYKGQFIISIVLSIISVSSTVIPYFCAYKIIDRFIYGTLEISYVLLWCIVGALAYLVKVIFFGVSTALSHNVAFNVVAGLRLKLTDVFLKAPLGEVQKKSIGQIKNVMVDKIENMEPPLAHMVPEGSGHLVLPIVSIVALFVIDYRLALASLITFPLAIISMGLTFKISGKNFDKYNESNAYMSSVIVEYVEGIEVIKAFGKTGVSYEKFKNAILNYKVFVIKWLTSTFLTMKFAFSLFPSTILGVLPVALYLAYNNTISISLAILAVLLSMSMVTSLTQVEVYTENLRQIQLTLNDVEEFMNMKELTIKDERVQIKSNDIEVCNVSFAYDGTKENQVLHNINLNLKKGSFTALVGPSGSGKSTIAKLIARFFDVDEGSILIGGVNIKDIPLNQLAENVSFVAQDNFLFNCSIMENIRLGNPKASDDEVILASKKAQCHEFIMNLENGYNTSAGEAGKRLSGGEKQRIAIARMILKNAPIIILDEATAFTDPENEAKIQQSLSSLAKGKTLLVIAHRLSTIKNADNIVVLKDGSVVAMGSQKELIDHCPLYKDMWNAHIGITNWTQDYTKEAI